LKGKKIENSELKKESLFLFGFFFDFLSKILEKEKRKKSNEQIFFICPFIALTNASTKRATIPVSNFFYLKKVFDTKHRICYLYLKVDEINHQFKRFFFGFCSTLRDGMLGVE